jgi:hypothetical protein
VGLCISPWLGGAVVSRFGLGSFRGPYNPFAAFPIALLSPSLNYNNTSIVYVCQQENKIFAIFMRKSYTFFVGGCNQ